jgi:hypothetical protein
MSGQIISCLHADLITKKKKHLSDQSLRKPFVRTACTAFLHGLKRDLCEIINHEALYSSSCPVFMINAARFY